METDEAFIHRCSRCEKYLGLYEEVQSEQEYCEQCIIKETDEVISHTKEDANRVEE